MSAIIDVTSANFKEVVATNDKVTVVDFWAPWCGYCVRMMPVYDELAAALGDKVTLTKVNTDEQPELAQFFKIEILPTFAIFKNGEIVDRKIGFIPLEELKAAVEANDLEAMKAKRDALNEVVQNLSVKLYEQAAAASQAAQGATGAEQASSQPQDGVVDADFEEVQD